MKQSIVQTGSNGPDTSDTICFICSNDQISLDQSNVFLTTNGLHSSDDEKQKIMVGACELLRVKYDIIEELFSENVHFPFCESCLKYVIELIGLRDELFGIETNLREKIRYIESSIAKSYKAPESLDQSEWKTYKKLGYRQSFQHEVMEEYWNKELVKKKVRNLNKTQGGFIEVNLSLIQLQMEKNVFKITKQRNEKRSTENLGVIDKKTNKEFSQKSLRKNRIVETQLDDINNAECEFRFSLVCPTNDNGDSENKNLEDDNDSVSDIQILRIRDEVIDITEIDNSTNNSSNKPPIPRDCEEGDEVADSDSSINDPNYELPSKKQRLDKTLRIRSGNSSAMSATTPPVITKTDTRCSFCPAKFDNQDLLRDHLQVIHFTASPLEAKQVAGLCPDALQFDNDDGDENNIEDFQAEDIYDPAELMEVFPEKDEPIMSVVSSDSSGSEEEEETGTVTRGRAKNLNDDSTVTNTATKSLKRPRGFSTNKTYIANDNTAWTTFESPTSKNKNQNILRESGKLLGPAADSKLTPIELFKLMISPNIVDLIVEYTNKFAEEAKLQKSSTNIKNNEKNPSNIQGTVCSRPTTREEIYAYIGMLLYLGLEKKSQLTTNAMWNTNGKYRITCISATMSRDRFQFLTRNLRFDDQVSRQRTHRQRQNSEKLSYVSDIVNPFVANIESYLRPYENLVVDEILTKFIGMPKSYGNGIRIWACCDSKTGYILRLLTFEGKGTGTDNVDTELGRKVTLALVKKYFGTGRSVTTDNFFTSKALALDLLKQKMSLLGTLNKHTMDVIPEFEEVKGREVESSIFAFQHGLTMISYVPRHNKAVVLLSSQQNSSDINTKTNKPITILDYNRTKGAVDTTDEMIASSSCQRPTQRWTMKIFYAMCDIGALNAYFIWQMHQKKLNNHPSRFNFLRLLSEALMEPLIKNRAETGWLLSANTKLSMQIMGYNIPKPEDYRGPAEGSRGCCKICKGRGKLSRKMCRNCQKWICKEHSVVLVYCVNCNPFATSKVEMADRYIKVERMKKANTKCLSNVVENSSQGIHKSPSKNQNQADMFDSLVEVQTKRKGIPAEKNKPVKVSKRKANSSGHDLSIEMNSEKNQPLDTIHHSVEISEPSFEPSRNASEGVLSQPTRSRGRRYTSPDVLSSARLCQSMQNSLCRPNMQPHSDNLPFTPPNCDQTGESINSLKVRDSPIRQPYQKEQSYLLADGNNQKQLFVSKPKMVFKPNELLSLPVYGTTKTQNFVSISNTNVSDYAQPNRQVIPMRVVKSTDMSDEREQTIPENVQDTDDAETEFDEYDLR